LILALQKHAVHNVVTSMNNSSMQSEIWCYKFKIAFPGAFGVTSSKLLFPEHFCNYFE